MVPVVGPQAGDPRLPLDRRADRLAGQREIALEAADEESVRLREGRLALQLGHDLAGPQPMLGNAELGRDPCRRLHLGPQRHRPPE